MALQKSPTLAALTLNTDGTGMQHKDPPLPWYIIHPASKPKLWWDMWSMLILVYTVIVVPVRLSFDVEEFCPDPLWWIEAVIDICFVCDFVLNWFTAVYTARMDGDAAEMGLSTSLGAIACEYLRSWFLIDVVSSAPIDLCFSLFFSGCNGAPIVNNVTYMDVTSSDVSSFAGTARLVRILRLIKLLKVLRVFKLQSRMTDLGDRVPILNFPILKIFPTLFVRAQHARTRARRHPPFSPTHPP